MSHSTMIRSEIEASFQAAIDAGRINGAHICATDSKGHFVYNKTLGQRTLLSGEKKPYQLDDVLFLASGTKLLTAVAALACVDDGVLSLTGDLSIVAPELAAMKVLTGFSEDGEPIFEPQARPITLEMLLTHSSGLTYHFTSPLIAEWRERFSPSLSEDDKLTVEERFNFPLTCQPGSSWMYGPGLDWAGRIVERVTGKSLCEWLHERVFARLCVTDAEFYPITREDLRPRLANLTPDDPDCIGSAVLGDSDLNKHTKGDFGGHGIFMTTPDYTKVLSSLLANDSKILKPATVNTMFEDHLSLDARAGLRVATTRNPMADFFLVGTSPDKKAGYGLSGLLTLEDNKEFYGAHTLSWGGGMTFAWFIDPKNDLCGAAAVQATVPIDVEIATELKDVFRHDIYRKRASWKTDQVA